MKAIDRDVTIRGFLPGDEAAFRRLNEEWISHYFVIESKDLEALDDPHGHILDPGGRILFALRDGRHIGCCALVPMRPGEFEVAKMAVTESCRGSGIGRSLLESVIAEAHAAGATRLFLETNHRLRPAIRLYESVGFRHIAPERVAPSVYARADVYMELVFNPSPAA